MKRTLKIIYLTSTVFIYFSIAVDFICDLKSAVNNIAANSELRCTFSVNFFLFSSERRFNLMSMCLKCNEMKLIELLRLST